MTEDPRVEDLIAEQLGLSPPPTAPPNRLCEISSFLHEMPKPGAVRDASSTANVTMVKALAPARPRSSSIHASIAAMTSASRMASDLVSKYVWANRRVVKYGLSLPIIFVFSVAIGVSYGISFATSSGVEWVARDLTGDTEWASHTRGHLARDPVELLEDLLHNTTIGVDTSVSVNFVAKYGVTSEGNISTTIDTFKPQYLDPAFIETNGLTIAGQMAGAFEAYGAWPCRNAVTKYSVLTTVCKNPETDWFAVQLYNNPVATTSEKASTYLSLDYTPMALRSARIWSSQAPARTSNSGLVVRGHREGTYAERNYFLLKLERGELALAPVVPCDRTTQSNVLECDHLEHDDVYVRNYASRDFTPLHKLDKLKLYGPALAMGNFVAADKTFVMLPATAIVMTNTGYAATTRFSTTFPFRFTIRGDKLLAEYSIPQVASFTPAVGNGFATATAQMVVVCLIVFNAIAHCHTTAEIVQREGRIFGFQNHITMGIIARRLGTYKFVFVQLCIYHILNVGKYFSAVFYGTQKSTDTIAFGAEGLLLVVVSSMLLDQLIFFEQYSSARESLSVVLSCALYLLLMYLNTSFFLSSSQVQVTELSICAKANSCTIIHGYQYYYAGLVVALLIPELIVNGPIHAWVVATRSRRPHLLVSASQLTSFEQFCLGVDARVEFGDFSRDGDATPISIVHAAGFTYVGPYLVRIKDFYMVVLARYVPTPVVETSGMTLSVFTTRRGRVVAGQHMMLRVAYKLFREAQHDQYAPIP